MVWSRLVSIAGGQRAQAIGGGQGCAKESQYGENVAGERTAAAEGGRAESTHGENVAGKAGEKNGTGVGGPLCHVEMLGPGFGTLRIELTKDSTH